MPSVVSVGVEKTKCRSCSKCRAVQTRWPA